MAWTQSGKGGELTDLPQLAQPAWGMGSDTGAPTTAIPVGEDEERGLLGKGADGKERRDAAMPLCKLNADRRLVLLNPRLFVKKTGLVFGGSYALVPLMMSKSVMPAGVYVALLLVIHIGVLIVYCWRVQFRSLDVDRVSLGARVLGLAVVTWLLSAVSGWQDHDHMGVLAAQMLVLCVVHTFVLALLMVAVEPLGGRSVSFEQSAD